MKPTLEPFVEAGRIAGKPGCGPNGAFRLTHPGTGRTLYCIVSDGRDWQESELPGTPWEHVSVSTKTHAVPRWEEMCWVKSVFWEPTDWVVQYHPAESDYVNIHPGALHLWKPVGSGFPVPPKECV